MRKAKIVATVGPASNTKEKLEELCKSGVNVFRLNMSHGDQEGHLKVVKALRKLQKTYPIAILGDIQGPKIRVGSDVDIQLEKNKTYEVGSKSGQGDFWTPNFSLIKKSVKPGEVISFSDGQIQSVVEKVGKTIKIKIVQEGKLTSNKGMNLPQTHLKLSCLTEKDKKDILFLRDQEVEYIALSFVQTAEDISQAREYIKDKVNIVAKIELPLAIKNIDSIIDEADSVMVARGDLAVEVGNSNFPKYQKEIIRKCNEKAKPVITATQMMESMTQNLNPTRAEVMDVYNAVLDGSDALMLSGETATGVNPPNVVKTMAEIIEKAETEGEIKRNIPHEESITSNLQSAGIHLAEKVQAKAIVSLTDFGKSCRKMAAYKTSLDVYGVTNNKRTFFLMALYRGIIPVLVKGKKYKENLPQEVLKKIRKDKGKGLIVSCSASAQKGSNNFIEIKKV